MVKGCDKVAGLIALSVAGCLMFGAYLAVWQRVLDAVAGRTAYSQAAFAGVVAAGLLVGVGSAWWPCRRLAKPDVLLRFVFLIFACWLVFELAALRGITGGWQRILMDTTRTFGLALQTLAKTALFFFAVPAIVSGVAVRAAAVHTKTSVPSAVAFMLLCVLPTLGGYVLAAELVPFVGVECFTRLAALWFGALASLAVLVGVAQPTKLRRIAAALPFTLAVGLLVMFNPKGQETVLTDGVFGRLVHRDSGFAQGQPVFVHHSPQHTVTVYADDDYQFVFALDGRPMLFGNRFHTARTLTGYIPLLLRPACKKAAVIGPEAGFYLPFLVRAGVPDVSYEGSEAALVKLTRAADGYVTGDEACENTPLRQGANLSSGSAYDLLFLAPEPVWMRDTQASVSPSVFRRCRAALAPNGIVALHLDARALSPGRFASIAKAFAAEFAGVQVWCTGAYDWLLVGSATEIKAPMDGMLGMLEKPPVFRDLVRAGLQSLPEVLACLVCDGKGLGAWLKTVTPESGWQARWRAPQTAFAKEKSTLQPGTLERCRQWKSEWVLPGELDVDVYLAVLDKVGKSFGARVLAVKALAETAKGHSDAGLEAARAAAKINPRDALLIQFSETLELEGRRRIKIGDFKGALKCYENLLSFAVATARSHYGMGYCLRANGDNEIAYLHFARAVAAAPEQTGYRLELAQVSLLIGEYAEADRQYQEVLKREPDNPDVLFRYAKGLAAKERSDKNMPQALKLAERACVLTEWRNTEYAYGLADLYMEAGRVLEGMGLKRRIKEGFPAAPVSSAAP